MPWRARSDARPSPEFWGLVNLPRRFCDQILARVADESTTADRSRDERGHPRMKRLIFKALLVLLVAGVYIASPFITAWSIREAVRDGNSDYLARVIDWPGVRETLKPQLSRIALDLPDPSAAPITKPGLWQRFKAYWGQGAVNRAIDGYITPEGLPQLFTARKLYRDYISGQPEESKLPVIERMKKAWARVKRAEFTSLTTFEIDMADKHDESRVYLGKLHLTGSGWMLKELRIRFETTADASVKKLSSAPIVQARRGWSPSFITPAEAAPLDADSETAYDARPAKLSFWAKAKAAARSAYRGDR